MASLNALRAKAEAWLQAVGEARAAAFPAPADLGAVDGRHPEVTSAETVRAIRGLLVSDRVGEGQRPRLRLLVRFLEGAVAAARSRSATRALEEARRRPAVETEDASLSVGEAEATLVRTEDRSRRLVLERGLDRAWTAQRSLVERRAEAVREAALALGLPGPLALGEWKDEEGVALDRAGFLRRTEDGYRDVMGWALGKMESGLGWGEATLGDLARLRALPFYPGALPSSEVLSALRAWTRTFGEGPGLAGGLELRVLPTATEPRGIAVEIPRRVVVLVPAEGPAADAPGTFDRWGWAQSLVRTELDSPVEHRWMGDSAVRGASGWLVRALLWREGWLSRGMGLGRVAARAVARMQALLALAELRAAAALAPFARTMLDSGPTPGLLREAAQALGGVLQVRAGVGSTLAWLQRVGPHRDPLRASALAACIRDQAEVRFDAEDFRNPTAARWLASLWARGAPETAERMAPALSGQPLTLEPVARSLVAVLGA
jgi:hypothetical protein